MGQVSVYLLLLYYNYTQIINPLQLGLILITLHNCSYKYNQIIILKQIFIEGFLFQT